MSSFTTQSVPTGPYFGFTLAEMETELTRYKEARKLANSNLRGSTVNGQSYNFGERIDGNIDEWQTAIQAALYYLDPGRFPFQAPTNAAVVAFI